MCEAVFVFNQSKVDKHVLSLIFVLYFYSHIYLSATHFTFCYLFLHIFFLDLEKVQHWLIRRLTPGGYLFLFNE
jgi:hypothetical protein